MFYKHTILNVNGEEILYLYLTDIYEIASEGTKHKSKNIYEKINNYLYNMNVDYHGNKVMLVIDNIIMGTLNIYDQETDNPTYKFKQLTDNFLEDKNLEIIDVNDQKDSLKEYIKNYQPIETLSPSIKVKNGRQIIDTDINTYLTNKLINTVPLDYHIETLKSYSVILRTALIKNLHDNKVLRDDNYLERNDLIKLFSEYEKARQAILATDKEYLTYSSNRIMELRNGIIGNYKREISVYSANCLANLGYNYREILKKFYPNSIIKLYYI